MGHSAGLENLGDVEAGAPGEVTSEFLGEAREATTAPFRAALVSMPQGTSSRMS